MRTSNKQIIRKESPPILLSSSGTDVVLSCMLVEEAESLLSRKSNRYFEYIYEILKTISNLGNQQIEKLSIQDSFALLVYYRMYFWDDAEVASVGDTKIRPSDFIGKEEDSGEKKYIKIGDKYTFNPIIRLGDAINAEKLALSSGDYSGNLRRYILAAGCTKNIDAGLEVMKSLEANAESLGQMVEYTEAIMKVSPVKVDMMHKDGAIMIVTQGGEPIALGFRGSVFFTFWV